jgi:hypothetical protein
VTPNSPERYPASKSLRTETRLDSAMDAIQHAVAFPCNSEIFKKYLFKNEIFPPKSAIPEWFLASEKAIPSLLSYE